jgi:hypothetical protein
VTILVGFVEDKVTVEQGFRRFRKINEEGGISFVLSVVLSVRNNSAPTGRVFTKFDIS